MNTPLSIAPMIDYSNTHFRVLMRLIAPRSLVYTEMQTTGAVLNNPEKALNYQSIEHPIALQLGGSDPNDLAECARMAEQMGFDEVNLNLGCPSDRVQSGHFGACLMKNPQQVVACIKSMKNAVQIPVTAKTRIGVDHEDSYEYFSDFACQLIDAGVDKLIVHSRKAWLKGLNPKQNRTIPPVHYDYVYRLKEAFPKIPMVINGNIVDGFDIQNHLKHVDGVMLGRLACDNPYKIAALHHQLHPECVLESRLVLMEQYFEYMINQYKHGVSLSLLIKPIFNWFHGVEGASQWKRDLTGLIQTRRIDSLDKLFELLIAPTCCEAQ